MLIIYGNNKCGICFKICTYVNIQVVWEHMRDSDLQYFMGVGAKDFFCTIFDRISLYNVVSHEAFHC